MIPARVLLRAGSWSGAAVDRLALDYEARFLRRKRLTTAGGLDLLVDLPEAVSLNTGDALETENGQRVEIAAAPEPLLQITGPDLVRLAWHIGNRHTPCQIEAGRLLIRRDHVLADMLARLGATLAEIEAPFSPEGGAYGHGRTFGHDHGPAQGPGAGAGQSHDHSHDHGHGHAH